MGFNLAFKGLKKLNNIKEKKNKNNVVPVKENGI
jgi:hypothetical protein